MTASDRFDVTTDFSRLAEADAILDVFPRHWANTSSQTSATLNRPPTPLLLACEWAVDRLGIDHLSPNDPRNHAASIRKSRPGLRQGFFLAYSPEREDPGRQNHSTQTIPKLVGGIDAESGKIALSLYQKAIQEVILVSSAEVAEAAKLLENIYRSVNIALVNELKVLMSAMGINVWEVIEAAATKPFGFQPFYPGPGSAATASRLIRSI